jgi:Dipeptidyl peptidase IV (DPP IV) N-terminal region/WD40-like Beta Propeller Repeat
MSVGQPEAALAWSPDGRRLVFVAYTPPLYHSQLFTVGSDATGLQQITSGCGADEATWSVNGTIAFRNGGCQQTGIYAIRPDGSRLRRLTDNRSPAFPDWSPDGSELAYTGEVNYGEQQDVFICNANGGGARQLTRRGGAQPAWSPDGKYVAFIRNNDLYVMRRDGRRLRLLVRGPSSSTPNEWYVVSSPSWQPLPHGATPRGLVPAKSRLGVYATSAAHSNETVSQRAADVCCVVPAEQALRLGGQRPTLVGSDPACKRSAGRSRSSGRARASSGSGSGTEPELSLTPPVPYVLHGHDPPGRQQPTS